ncbi:DUF2000 family protein [Micromonospora echinaurantiaca]
MIVIRADLPAAWAANATAVLALSLGGRLPHPPAPTPRTAPASRTPA